MNSCVRISTVGLIALLFAVHPAGAASAETYRYDALGRLMAVTYDSGEVLKYSYDDNGNLLNRAVTDAMAADINGDSSVNAVDVQLTINEVLGIETGEDADINRDGSINAVDVQLVINAALGIEISGSL